MRKLVVFFGSLIMAVSMSVAGSDKVHAQVIAVTRSGAAIKVSYITKENRFARVSISDHKGNRVFNEVVKSRRGFICSYHVANLASGHYVVQVADSNGSWSEAFTIEKATEGEVADYRN